MNVATVVVSLDADLLWQLDACVAARRSRDRYDAIARGLAEQLARVQPESLEEALAEVDPEEERRWADMGLRADAATWTAY